jgi:hypothetical protein
MATDAESFVQYIGKKYRLIAGLPTLGAYGSGMIYWRVWLYNITTQNISSSDLIEIILSTQNEE